MTTADPRAIAVARAPRRRVQLLTLTVAKTVANTALRWLGPFLPTLERAFGTTVGTLTTILAIAEMGGLSTLASGRLLDRGHRRRVFLAGSAAVTVSSLVALGGSIRWFALAAVVLLVGVANLTVAGLAWISERVPYAGRGRAIGVFELSWALSLCIGGPLIAVLIDAFGWRGPFVALAIASAVVTVVVAAVVPADHVAPRPRTPDAPGGIDTRGNDAGGNDAGGNPAGGDDTARTGLPGSAWPPILASALVAAAGLAVFVLSGAWLSDRYGVSTAGLGLVVTGFGLLELVASGSSAAFSDRIGKRRAVLAGMVVCGAGIVVTASAGPSLLVAVVGLTVFLTGFEFAFVTSLSLVSEAAPAARGRALGVGNSVGTVTRAAAVFASGQLYEAVGFGGSLALSAVVGVVAFAMVLATRTR